LTPHPHRQKICCRCKYQNANNTAIKQETSTTRNYTSQQQQRENKKKHVLHEPGQIGRELVQDIPVLQTTCGLALGHR
jgi:hypothetical protein